MYYEINVSFKGRHYFATAERSLLDADRANELFYAMREKFPSSEGYHVTLTRYEKIGHAIA